MNKFLQSEFKNLNKDILKPENALFHILPVPYEASVSYGHGTKNGPRAILEASDQLELYNSYSKNIPANLGIYTHKAVNCKAEPKEVHENIYEASLKIIKKYPQAIPVILGGEHSVSFGALKALKESKGDFTIIHFDAHADLRPSYEGSIYSHASIMHRAVKELGLDLIQFATRAYSSEEVEIRKKYKIISFDSSFLYEKKLPEIITNPNIYLSFDVDAFDPALMPATGTPVPGGIGYFDALKIIKTCLKNKNLIAFDVVELAPIKNLEHPNFTSAQLVYDIMGLVRNQ